MKLGKDEKLIRLESFNGIFITTSEYEALRKEIMARWLCDDIGPVEKVIIQMLIDSEYRYNEIRV
jgi:hypothetical protein